MVQEFTQEIKNIVLDILRGVHTVIPGKIVTFDPDKDTASILPDGKFEKPDGSLIDYPKLNEVPVYVMQGSEQTATFVYPIKKDDECIILFSEQPLDVWRTKAESDTDLKFDLSNAIAIVGLFAKPNPLIKEACKDNSIIIEKDGERVRIKKGETYIRDTAGQSITFVPEVITAEANDLDLNSKKPIGIKGTNTQLGGGNLRKYWTGEQKGWLQQFLPPMPLGILFIPPVPILICMGLNSIRAKHRMNASEASSINSKILK